MKVVAVIMSIFLFACGDDGPELSRCVSTNAALDVAQLSKLEAGISFPLVRDVFVLSFAEEEMAADTRRVSSIEVPIMIPVEEFDTHPTNVELAAEVFDGADPSSSLSWRLTQRLSKEDLAWKEIDALAITRDGGRTPARYQLGWWTFDFTRLIPEGAMTSTQYAVGLAWDSTGLPQVGYSEFNLPCAKDWSHFHPAAYPDEGGWHDLGASNDGPNCNWAYLRVTVEATTEQPGGCF